VAGKLAGLSKSGSFRGFRRWRSLRVAKGRMFGSRLCPGSLRVAIWAFSADFQELVPLKGRKTSAFLLFFPAIWAFSCDFLVFVPFSHLNQEAKQKKKGTKFQNFLQNAQCQAKNEPMRLIFIWHKGTKTGKTFENAQLPKAPGFLDSYYLFITGRVLS